MNQYQAINEFIISFCVVQSITQPTLPQVLPFDYTAYMTAKQIWLQNIKDVSEESAELRNKAQQLMKVLQYYTLPDQQNHAPPYHYRHKANHSKKEDQNFVNDHTNANIAYEQEQEPIQLSKKTKSKNQGKQKMKSSRQSNQVKIKHNKHQFVKSKQVEIKICRNWGKQCIGDDSKKSNGNSQCAPLINLVSKVKSTKYWDENVDNSNIQSQALVKNQITKQQSNKYSIINDLASDLLAQYPQFSRRPTQNCNRVTKIVQLNKMEYKKQIPKPADSVMQSVQGKEKRSELQQQQKEKHKQLSPEKDAQGQDKCKGNCVYIKYQCCCKCNQQNRAKVQDDSKYLAEEGRQSMRVNQFRLISPSARQSAYIRTDHAEQAELPAEKRVSARVQRVLRNYPRESKPKTQGNYCGKQSGRYFDDYQAEEQYEQSAQSCKHNENQTKIIMKKGSEFKQKKNVKHKRNKTNCFNEINGNNKQMYQQRSYEYEDGQNRKHSPRFADKQLKVVQLNLNKNKCQPGQRSNNQQRALMEQSRQIKQEEDAKMRELMQFRQMQQKEEKKRENLLLMRLREQFSQICCQEPNEDERRVSQQIKQLQLKLGQIVANNNNRVSKNCEPSSPKAKIVKLNLTPSRSNLHKNMPYFNKSTAPRSPANGKSSRLLSKKMENLSRVV